MTYLKLKSMKEKYILIGSNSSMAVDFAKYTRELGFYVIGVSNGKNINPYINEFLSTKESETHEFLTNLVEEAIIIYFAWHSPKRTKKGFETYQENLSIYDVQSYLSQIPLLKIRKFVFISSAGAIYGSSNSLNLEDSQIIPVTQYGKEKLKAEFLLIKNISKDKLLICRVTNPFGFHILPKNGIGFIDQSINTALENGSVNVFGSGAIERDYIHIRNVCEAICGLVELNLFGIFNICSGSQFTIYNLASIIKSKIKDCEINFIKVKESPIKTCKVSNQKLLNYLDIKMTNVYDYVEGYIEKKRL